MTVALYVWAREGRPVLRVETASSTSDCLMARACIMHERHSMAAVPARRGHWWVRRSGACRRPRPHLHARRARPGKTPPPLACAMQAVLDFLASTIDRAGLTWPLRPLVKPLFPYERKEDAAPSSLGSREPIPRRFVASRSTGRGQSRALEDAIARFTDPSRSASGSRIRRSSRTSTRSVGETEIYHTLVVISKTEGKTPASDFEEEVDHMRDARR